MGVFHQGIIKPKHCQNRDMYHYAKMTLLPTITYKDCEGNQKDGAFSLSVSRVKKIATLVSPSNRLETVEAEGPAFEGANFDVPWVRVSAIRYEWAQVHRHGSRKQNKPMSCLPPLQNHKMCGVKRQAGGDSTLTRWKLCITPNTQLYSVVHPSEVLFFCLEMVCSLIEGGKGPR